MSDEQRKNGLKGAEFISGSKYNTEMIEVKIIGEVNKPGVHLVPASSTLSKVLSYAAGPTDKADLEEVSIRSTGQSVNINFEDFLHSKSQLDPLINANDLIYIKAEDKIWDTQTLSIVTGILGIVVSGIIIKDRL